jgi:DNA repair protein RadC
VPKDAPPDKPHYLGHRQRLREKLLEKGPEAFADYELLELLLAQAIPRIDVKPLAKDLLHRFSTFAGVVAATPAAIEGQRRGRGRHRQPEDRARRRLADEPAGSERAAGHGQLAEPARLLPRQSGRGEEIEQFHLLFLDGRNALIAHERQQTGTVNHAPVYPREVAKRALELGARAIIMVHNHPSGDPTPSRDDVAITKACAAALEKLDIILHDPCRRRPQGPCKPEEPGADLAGAGGYQPDLIIHRSRRRKVSTFRPRNDRADHGRDRECRPEFVDIPVGGPGVRRQRREYLLDDRIVHAVQ